MSEKESIVSGLYAQKRHHESKIEYWSKQKLDVDENLRKHTEQLAAIERNLEKIYGKSIEITRHAIERFQTRIGPLDATEETIRNRLLTPRVENAIRTLTNGEFITDDELIRIVVQDMKIITVYKADISKEEYKEHRKQKRKKYGPGKQ